MTNEERQEFEQLKTEVRQLRQAVEHRDQTISGYEDVVSRQRHRIRELERMLFGQRRERFIGDPNQTSMEFEALSDEQAEQAVAEAKAEEEPETETVTVERRKPARRGEGVRCAEEVEEKHVYLDPEEPVDNAVCVGEETSVKISYTPSKIVKVVYHRRKYITREDSEGRCRQLIAPVPGVADRCEACPDLLAHIAVSKYADHLPIYRQLKMLERGGVSVPASTMESWQRITARALRPLHAVLRRLVVNQSYVQADESPLPVLDRDKPGATHRGYMWVYHAVTAKLLFFEYQKGRGGKFPLETLRDFRGHLQTDGYDAYLQFERMPHVTHVGCWAHARRKFEHALNNDRIRAEHALSEIRKLYAVEREAAESGLDAEQTKALRLEKSLPVINRLGEYLAGEYKNVLPKSPMGQAICYCTERWTVLSNYLLDGNLKIDNNLVENAIRPLALGRKNYLFAGSHQAAEDIAMYYSFLACCKLNGINPEKWLSLVLEKIPYAKPSQYPSLLPSQINFENLR